MSAKVLLERMLDDQGLELTNEVGMTTEIQLCLDSLLERRQPELF